MPYLCCIVPLLAGWYATSQPLPRVSCALRLLLLLQLATAQHAAALEQRAEAFMATITARRVMSTWLVNCQEARAIRRAMAQARIGALQRAIHAWAALVRRLQARLSLAAGELLSKHTPFPRLLCSAAVRCSYVVKLSTGM